MQRQWATDAIALEYDFLANDGRMFNTRDSAVDAYVRMCREKDRYVVSPSLKILPDYYVTEDGRGWFVLGFELHAGRTDLGKLTCVYTDDTSLTMETEEMTITVKQPLMEETKRWREDEIRRGFEQSRGRRGDGPEGGMEVGVRHHRRRTHELHRCVRLDRVHGAGGGCAGRRLGDDMTRTRSNHLHLSYEVPETNLPHVPWTDVVAGMMDPGKVDMGWDGRIINRMVISDGTRSVRLVTMSVPDCEIGFGTDRRAFA